MAEAEAEAGVGWGGKVGLLPKAVKASSERKGPERVMQKVWMKVRAEEQAEGQAEVELEGCITNGK